MKSPRQYNLRNFVLLSLIIHLAIVQASGYLLNDDKKQKAPIHVKFTMLEEEKKADLKWIKGEIVDIPKPAKIEKPLTHDVLSEYNSRAHYNKSFVKKNKYKSSKTISPRNKPKSKSAFKKKTLYKKMTVKKIKTELKKKSKKKIFVVKNTIKKDELKGKEKNPVALKGLFKEQDDKNKDAYKDQNSLFKGFDPEKYAKLDARDNEDESDTETVSLDSQELKYASYFSSIKRQIELVWSYPEQAISKGLQGQLLLQFMLDRSGKIIDIFVVHSSGYEILDDAALKAVKTASPYNRFPKNIRKKKLRIMASFKYKPFYTFYK